jgi:hypothetical protein
VRDLSHLRLSSRLLMCLSLLILASACVKSGGGAAPISTYSGPSVDPTPGSCAGPAPSNPPPGPGFVGEPPARFHIYAHFEARSSTCSESNAPKTRYGWRLKVLWLVRRESEATVRLSGENVGTGASILFENVQFDREPTARLVLDPTNPPPASKGETHFNFPTYMYFPRAGCYILRVVSAEGSWSTRFTFST